VLVSMESSVPGQLRSRCSEGLENSIYRYRHSQLLYVHALTGGSLWLYMSRNHKGRRGKVKKEKKKRLKKEGKGGEMDQIKCARDKVLSPLEYVAARYHG